MSNSTRKWIRSIEELLIHGLTGALIVGAIAWRMDISWPEWWMIVKGSFIGNGGLRLLQFVNNNPLPPLGDTDGEASGQKISLNPFSKVQPLALPAPPEPPKV